MCVGAKHARWIEQRLQDLPEGRKLDPEIRMQRATPEPDYRLERLCCKGRGYRERKRDRDRYQFPILPLRIGIRHFGPIDNELTFR